MSYVIALGTAVPEFQYSQEEITDSLIQKMQLEGTREARMMKALYKLTRIKSRYSVLPDYRNNGRSPLLFSGEIHEVPDVSQRMEVYREKVLPLALSAVQNCLATLPGTISARESITHIISVSCTGMSAPGLEIALAEKLGLRNDVVRFAVNFIGCYAAFHAMKIAHAVTQADPSARVLIVCVELCTLHFQSKTDPDNMLANSLFGDGAAAIMVAGEAAAKDHSAKKLRMKGFQVETLHAGKGDMTWDISQSGFLMRLSSYIPQLVEGGMRPLFDRLLENIQVDRSLIRYWGIHPGGKKILEACEKVLDIERESLESSYEVLAEYGNMSSPTILFVLEHLWNEVFDWRQDQLILLAGFGPGLTLESAILEIA